MDKILRADSPPSRGPRAASAGRRFRLGRAVIRRSGFYGLVVALALGMSFAMAEILSANGFGPLEAAILLLFAANTLWIALSACTAVAGFVIEVLDLDPLSLRRRHRVNVASKSPLRTRTAVVMAVRHEDPSHVAAAFEAIAEDLAKTGQDRAFDLWLFSGSTRADIIAQERRNWAALQDRIGRRHNAYYWKPENIGGRKAGMIAGFVQRWGGDYDHMVVLDADSLMTGRTLVELVRLMEANPKVGLIQTLPQPINQTTFFGRILQFASHLYGPVFSAGAAFWQLGEGNYYGHNAIIRVAAFAQHAALPKLPGAPPLGGEILSHDFVEAALLRRAGWHVVFVPHLGGSYEELPSNLLDYAARDRRWCQGNLQHLKVLKWRGLHPISRLHLFSGAFAFLASPIWLAFLVLGTVSMVAEALGGHDYFPGGYRLFPDWPISKWTESISLLSVTLIMLFLPKVLAVTVALVRRERRVRFGGTWRILAGGSVEVFFSVLMAPIMMALHTSFVAALAAGRSVGWTAQNRSDRGLSVAEAGSRLGILLVIAVAWATVLAIAVPDRLWWILPVLAGLVLSVPVAVVSSRSDLGHLWRASGFLKTPPESRPDRVLVRAAHAASEIRRSGPASAAIADLPLPPLAPIPMPPWRTDARRGQPRFGRASGLRTRPAA